MTRTNDSVAQFWMFVEPGRRNSCITKDSLYPGYPHAWFFGGRGGHARRQTKTFLFTHAATSGRPFNIIASSVDNQLVYND